MVSIRIIINHVLLVFISIVVTIIITSSSTNTNNNIFVAAACAVQESYTGSSTLISFSQDLDGCNIVIQNIVITQLNIRFTGQITGNTNITIDGVTCESTEADACIYFNQPITGAHSISIKNVRKHAHKISIMPTVTCEVYGVFFENQDIVHSGIRHLEFENIHVSAYCSTKRSYVYGVRVRGPIGSVENGSTLKTFRASNIVVRDSVIVAYGFTDPNDDGRACALSLGGEIFASSSVNDSSSLQTSMLVENLLIDNVSMNATDDLYANAFQIVGLTDPNFTRGRIEDFTTVHFRNNSINNVILNSTGDAADVRVISMWYARSINHKDINATSTVASTFTVENCSMRNVQSYYGKTSGLSFLALAIVDVKKDVSDFDQVVFKDIVIDNVLITSTTSDWKSEIWGVRIYENVHGRVVRSRDNSINEGATSIQQQQLLPQKIFTFTNVRLTNSSCLGKKHSLIRLFYSSKPLHTFNRCEFSNIAIMDVQMYGRLSTDVHAVILHDIDDSMSCINDSDVNNIKEIVVRDITVDGIIARADEVVNYDSELLLFVVRDRLDAHLELLSFTDLTIRNVDLTYIEQANSYVVNTESDVKISLVRFHEFFHYIRLVESSPQNVAFASKNLLIENVVSNSIGGTRVQQLFILGMFSIRTTAASYEQHINGALASPSSIRSFTFENSTIRNITCIGGQYANHFYAMKNFSGFNQITVNDLITHNTRFLHFEGNGLRSRKVVFFVSVIFGGGIDTQLLLSIAENGDITRAVAIYSTDFAPNSQSQVTVRNVTLTDFISTLIGMRDIHVYGVNFRISANGYRSMSTKNLLISGIFFHHERSRDITYDPPAFIPDTGAFVRLFISYGDTGFPATTTGVDVFEVENLTVSHVEYHGVFSAAIVSGFFFDSVMRIGQSLSAKDISVTDVYLEGSHVVQVTADYIATARFPETSSSSSSSSSSPTLLELSNTLLRNVTIVTSMTVRVSTVQTLIVKNVDTYNLQNIVSDSVRVSYDNRQQDTITAFSIECAAFNSILLQNIGTISFQKITMSNSISSYMRTTVLNKNQYDKNNEKPNDDSGGFSMVGNVMVGTFRESRRNPMIVFANTRSMSIPMPDPEGIVNCQNLVVDDVKMNNVYVATASAAYTAAAANVWLMGNVEVTSSLVLSNAAIEDVVVKNTLGKAMMSSLLLNDGEDGMKTKVSKYEVNNAKIERSSLLTRDLENGFAAIFGASSPLTNTTSIKIQSSHLSTNIDNTNGERSSCATSPALCSLARFNSQTAASSSTPTPPFEIEFNGNTLNVPSQEYSSFIVATDNFLETASLYSSVKFHFTKNTFTPSSNNGRHYLLTPSKYEHTSPLLTTLSGSKWSFECDNTIENDILRFFDQKYTPRNAIITHCKPPSFTKTYVKVPTKSLTISKELSPTESIIPPIPKWISPLRSASDGMLAATTIMQAFVSPTMVMGSSRARSAFSIASRIADGECGVRETDLDLTLGVTSSPLRIRFPKEQGGTASGAVIGNALFLFIIFILFFGGYVLFQRYVVTRPRNPRTGKRYPPPPLKECIFESQSLSAVFLTSMVLLGPSLESTVLLVAVGSVPVLWKVVSILIWFVIIVGVVFGLLVGFRLIFRRKQIEAFVRKSSSGDSTNNNNNINNKSEDSASAWASRFKWLLGYLILPEGEWELPKRRNQLPGARERDKYDHRPVRFSSSEKTDFRYLLPFIEGYNDRFSINHRFFLVDLTVAVILSFCSFAGSKEHVGCLIMAIMSCITFGSYGLITLFFRPNGELIMKIANPLFSLLSFALVLCSLVGVEELTFAGLMTFMAVSLLILSILTFVGFLWPGLESVFDAVKNRVTGGSGGSKNNNNRASGGGSSGGSDNNNDNDLNELLLMPSAGDVQHRRGNNSRPGRSGSGVFDSRTGRNDRDDLLRTQASSSRQGSFSRNNSRADDETYRHRSTGSRISGSSHARSRHERNRNDQNIIMQHDRRRPSSSSYRRHDDDDRQYENNNSRSDGHHRGDKKEKRESHHRHDDDNRRRQYEEKDRRRSGRRNENTRKTYNNNPYQDAQL